MGERGYTSSETDPVLKAACKSVRPDAYSGGASGPAHHFPLPHKRRGEGEGDTVIARPEWGPWRSLEDIISQPPEVDRPQLPLEIADRRPIFLRGLHHSLRAN